MGCSFQGRRLSNAADDYFKNILCSNVPRPCSINLTTLGVAPVDLSSLELPFWVEEIEQAIKAMPRDKAPCPDGFTGRFYCSCWHIIKGDILRAFERFYYGDMRGLTAINKALVTLLPKKYGATELKDYRPVSLVHGLLKIFDKVLANRLAL